MTAHTTDPVNLLNALMASSRASIARISQLEEQVSILATLKYCDNNGC